MIKVDELTKIYKNGKIEVEALKGVSFEIEKGEMVAIMGPSGSGKSTLMHIIGCLDKATSGYYSLNNQDVSKASEKKLAEIRNKEVGFVFQQFNLLNKTSVLHNVVVPLIYKGVSKKERIKRAKDLLTKVGLDHRMDHYPNEISGGQKQRVAVARALANNPSLILADEPTGNLDTKTGEEIMDLFQKLNDQGHTIILVTHEHNIAAYAERTINIVDGRIVKDVVA
ncbi:MAG: ABC transporter ATP-binding protein [Bacillota bacterium]